MQTMDLKEDSTIRVVMVIDHLGSGGAERQFCMVAIQLKMRGVDVHVVVFQPNKFSVDVLHEYNIPVTTLVPRNVVHLIVLMRSFLVKSGAHVVIAFLKWSSLIVELSSVPGRRFSLVVSERSLEVDGRAFERRIRYNVHRLADAIVCNSFAQRNQLVEVAPGVKTRTTVIVNGVDLEYFRPCRTRRTKDGVIRILILARYSEQKNPFRFLEGLVEFRDSSPHVMVEVDWYGYLPRSHLSRRGRLPAHYRTELAAADVYKRLSAAICARGLEGQFRLHGESKDVLSLYSCCSVVCVPSIYEGCSNVIGEALACGLPVLASDISDNGRLVKEGVTGFLFDPRDPKSIGAAIGRYARTAEEDLATMASASRETARVTLSPDALGERFATVIDRVLHGQLEVHLE